MKKRPLGNSGLQIAPLMFGGNVFGWTVDEKRSFELLDAFVDAGFDSIDTADIYSNWVPGNTGGDSERIIGRWMKERGNRASLVIATKVGKPMGPDKKGLKKAYILQAAEASLKRLQTDYLDLYLAHEDDTETPLEETMEAFDILVRSGKVRAVGASNYEADRLSQALLVSKSRQLHRYEVLQPHYNLYDRSHFESGLEELCQDAEVGVIAYYSLASGFLTGKYRSAADQSKSVRGGGMKEKYLNPRGFRILEALDTVSKAMDANPTQIALAWLLQRPAVTAPIVSATSLEQLQDVIKAPHLQLSAEAVNLLDQASRP